MRRASRVVNTQQSVVMLSGQLIIILKELIIHRHVQKRFLITFVMDYFSVGLHA